MYSFTQQGMAFFISFLRCCGRFLTVLLSPGQFQTFWSPTAPCTSFNCYRVLTTKPKTHRKSLTHDSVDWRRKNVSMPCKHCILHLQSVVMQQLTLRKAAIYRRKRAFRCSTRQDGKASTERFAQHHDNCNSTAGCDRESWNENHCLFGLFFVFFYEATAQ